MSEDRDCVSIKRHQPIEVNQAGIDLMDQIRYQATVFDEIIENGIKSSREKSLALTKLEELRMWTNRAIALEFEEI